jgi:hypothetical protein
MQMRELEEALRLTFEDQRLSKSEKYDFRGLLQTYNDDDISGALFAAHARSVRVRIITDNDRGSDIETLLDKGVAVVKDSAAIEFPY